MSDKGEEGMHGHAWAEWNNNIPRSVSGLPAWLESLTQLLIDTA